MQGRFTSPDPIFFQNEMLLDSQRFNLYAYVRNNPLKLVDPDGLAIELTGDEAERQRRLELLRQMVGTEAGAYLYEKTVGNTLNPSAGGQVVPTAITYRGTKPIRLDATITIASGDFNYNTASGVGEILGHEATHAADLKGLALSGVGVQQLWAEFDKIRYKSEFEAYMLSGSVRQVLEPEKTYQLPGNIPIAEHNQLPRTITMVPLWNPSWATLDAAKIHKQRSWSINSVLMTPKNQRGHYGLQPPKP